MVKSGYKTPQQVEFAELADLLRAKFSYNWTRIGQIARVSPQMVSLIRKGARSPGEPSLQLLRQHLNDLTIPQREAAVPMREQIAFLEKNSPADLEVARTVVDVVYRRVKTEISSGRLSVEEETATAAAAAAQQLAQESGRSRKAGAPSGGKPAPAGGAEKGSK